MSKIFEEYGGVIVTVVVIVFLMTLLAVMLRQGGPIDEAFEGMVEKFAARQGE